MLKIGIDWDDTFAPFNSIACEMATERFGIAPPLTINDIESWENTGRAARIKDLYYVDELYRKQSAAVTKENIAAVRELMKIADVYFISAVYPAFMTVRATQILNVFPELPANKIILGGAKDLVQFDIIIDDCIKNVLDSPAEYPVLMRKPWNKNMTGLLSVNSLEEFVLLVKHIIAASNDNTVKIDVPTVVALVGPSGSGKNELAEKLCWDFFFERPRSYTTNPGKNRAFNIYVPEEHFDKSDYIESTSYAGYSYGTREEEIDEILGHGLNAVIPLDMCGAIGMKKRFPTVIIYTERAKEELIQSIVSSGMSNDEKTMRLLSLDAERKNKALADIVIKNDGDAVNRLLNDYFPNC